MVVIDLDERDPPHDIGAEQCVLGAVMLSPTAAAALVDQLARSDFYRPQHQEIWDAILDLYRRGAPIGPVAVLDHLGGPGLRAGIDGPYLHTLIQDAPGPAEVDYYAGIVRRLSARRGTKEAAVRVLQGIDSGRALDDVLADLAQDVDRMRLPIEARPDPSSYLVDWKQLLTADFGDVDYLAGKLMARAQQIALIGNGKVGKSVLVQEWLWRMSAGLPFLGDRPRDPVRVLYLDAENGHADLQDRFRSFGATPETLDNLVYASFPPLPPLDTSAGGAALLALAQDVAVGVVAIDTASRFISGPENDSDTWLALYRCTLRLLKAAGIGSVRLDHFGKDVARGARGSSAKTQDVDQVWELTEAGGGLFQLRRTHTRTGLGPGSFTIRRLGEKDNGRWKTGGTRHILPTTNVFLGVDLDDLIARIDSTGIPRNAGRDKVRAACIEHHISLPGTDVLAEAIKQRKALGRASDSSPAVCPGQVPVPGTVGPVQQDQDRSHEIPGQSCPGQIEDSSGQAEPGPVLSSPPPGGGQVGQPSPGDCPTCGWPVDSNAHETKCGGTRP